MLKNRKLSTVLTVAISTIVAICIVLLFVVANKNMTTAINDAATNNMKNSLQMKTRVIEEYVTNAEELLCAYSKAPAVVNLLKDPSNTKLQKIAQEYTVKYYEGLDQWEGIYIDEWDTHVIAHSNPKTVGITMREGDSRKQLQDAITKANGIYNTGILVSPASKKLVLSMYCPVFDEDGKTMIGFVGGATLATNLKNMLDSMKTDGLENATYSLINVATGQYIFNKDESLIMKDIEDKVLLSIMDDIHKNEKITYGSKEYTTEKDIETLAAYQYMSDRGWAVIMGDSKSEIFEKANTNKKSLGTICIISFILITVLAWFLIQLSTRPLKTLEKSIIRLQNLDLSKNESLGKYINTKSEIGKIATAVDSLHLIFRNIVSTLNQCSTSLTESVDKMTDSSNVLSECIEDNSATAEQLAASTETTKDAITRVGEEVGKIADIVYKVDEKVQIGDEKSTALNENVQNMKTMATTSLQSTENKMEENQKKISEAMVNLQSLSRINDMVSQILDITSQTNLLSLNASIEAARAGESGRGFAVVASEIGNLASSSSVTAMQIQSICSETNENIERVQNCFNEITEFWKTDVSKQFEEFINIAYEYSSSIELIQNIIKDIKDVTDTFVDVVSAIKNQINTVQLASNENNVGVDDIIEKIGRTITTAEVLANVVETNQKNATAICDIVSKFSE